MSPYFGNVVLLASLFSTNVNAFWRMNCGLIQRGRIDTLISPGTISSHSHTILGASNFGVNATYDSLLKSECTSCEIQADKSAYWSPDLFYEYPDGSVYAVPHDGGVIYYLGRGPNREKIVPFPAGFSMISGKMTARSYDSNAMTWGNATYPGRPVADRVSFLCLDGSGQYPETPGLTRMECSYGMRAQIHFQACWNGVDLYKRDQSHVAYLSQIDNGVCPPSHPHQLPNIFMERLYSVANVPNKVPGGRFVFAQGDPTGYGFHADFQNGWEPKVLEAAVNDCLYTEATADGVIAQCPVLQASQDSNYGRICPERRPGQVAEPVTGKLSKLPGCIKVVDGPGDATPASWACDEGYVQPAVASTVDSSPRPTNTPAVGSTSGSQKYLGCFTDSEPGKRALSGASTSNSTHMTVDYCSKFCQSKGFRLSGVQYSVECFCGNALLPSSTLSDGCTMPCSGTSFSSGSSSVDMCGGSFRLNVYENTGSSSSSTASVPTTLLTATSTSTTSTSTASIPTTLVTSTSSSTTATSSSTSAASPSSTASPDPDYVGCATDINAGRRALSGSSTASSDMTISSCKAFCAQGGGHQFYGLEYSRECFCGNALLSPNTILNATSTPKETVCSMPCAGNSTQTCGGPNALSLFKDPAYISPEVQPSSSMGSGYVNKQCLTDPNKSGRALQGASLRSDTMTPDVCVQFCSGRGMRFAGVEYGTECFCGNQVLESTGARLTECRVGEMMTCKGDQRWWCGGPNLMTLYEKSG